MLILSTTKNKLFNEYVISLFQISEEELIFQVVRGTCEKRSDGSISVQMNCPFPNCDKNFRVMFQRYKSYYNAKKKAQTKQGGYRWRFSTLSQHISADHKITENNNESDDQSRSGDASESDDLNRSVGNESDDQNRSENVEQIEQSQSVNNNPLKRTYKRKNQHNFQKNKQQRIH